MLLKGIELAVPTSAVFSQICRHQQVQQNEIINLLTKPKMADYFRDVNDVIIVSDDNKSHSTTRGIQQTRKQLNNSTIQQTRKQFMFQTRNARENELHGHHHHDREWRPTVFSIQGIESKVKVKCTLV